MTDDTAWIEDMKRQTLGKKAKAFEMRVLLDRLLAQGNQLTDAWNKLCADIADMEKDIEDTEKRLAVLDTQNKLDVQTGKAVQENG